MGCTKTLTLSTVTCELETCETKPWLSVAPKFTDNSTAYASDICYCLVVTINGLGTESYFSKYDPATNTLVAKATYLGYVRGPIVYDEKHQKFVGNDLLSSKIVLFDPLTSALSTFDPGFACGSFVYIPEKQKVYGTMGTSGLGEYYAGYIDLDLLTVVQLGVIPLWNVPPPTPYQPYNWTYAPLNDCLYGAWINGFGQSALIKFNLATNTGSHIMSAVPGGLFAKHLTWDSDSALILACCGGTVKEIDVLTETVLNSTVSAPPGSSVDVRPVYVSSLKKMFAIGNDGGAGDVIKSYNTQTLVIATAQSDYDYSDWITPIKDGSFMAVAADLITSDNGVRRLCLT